MLGGVLAVLGGFQCCGWGAEAGRGRRDKRLNIGSMSYAFIFKSIGCMKLSDYDINIEFISQGPQIRCSSSRIELV